MCLRLCFLSEHLQILSCTKTSVSLVGILETDSVQFKQAKCTKGLGRDITTIHAALNLGWNTFMIDWETGSQVKKGISSLSPACIHDVIIS